MVVPILFLFVTSCGKQEAIDLESDVKNKVTELRSELCDLVRCGLPINENIVDELHIINGCSIYVSYKKETCPLAISIRNMTYTFANSSQCNSSQIWNQYFMNGQTLLANESINQFYKLLSQMVEDKILAGLPSNSSVGTLHFIETFCHTLCSKEIKYEDLPSFFELSQEKCGISCCVRSTTITIVDGKKVKSTAVLYEGGACNPIPVDCHGDMHISNICDPACARL